MYTKYSKLAEELKKEIIVSIENGIDRLPPEREISKNHNVSRQTVRQALFILEKEGLIYKKQGSGSIISGLIPGAEGNEIAIIFSSDSEYIFPSLLSELSDYFKKEGFSVSVYITQNRADKEREILSDLIKQINITHTLRGILVDPVRTTLPTANYDLYEKINSHRIPIVFLHGYYPNLTNHTFIKDDNYAGGHSLGQYLIQNGHTKIAGIFQIDTIQGMERYLGWSRAMIESNLSVHDSNVSWYTQEILENIQKSQDTGFIVSFIRNKLSSCSAVICHNDEIAYWLIKELNYAGLNVPQDISIVSFDNSYLSDLSKPRITSLSHGEKEMSSSCAFALLEQIRGRFPSPKSLSWKLLEKGSVTNI